MRRWFWFVSSFILLGHGVICYFIPQMLLLYTIYVPLFLLGVYDVFQNKKTILKNFPVLGHARYLLELIRPEIQQYFVESDTDGKPITRVNRSLVYQRSKDTTETVPFGTQLNVYDENYSWINHSMRPTEIELNDLKVTFGEASCKKPYRSSIFNISAMSYGSLSRTAIEALSGGASMGGFFINSGEGGVSPYHLKTGADIVWQIGTGYFGCRTSDGNFCQEQFQKMATHEQVKMIELKISQGAKPGHGGILPGVKVTQEIAEIRGVEKAKTVISPGWHKAFEGLNGLLQFVDRLRDLSGGKPVGIKLCLGRREEFYELVELMNKQNQFLDFITVDGGEGGTGAAPLELTNYVGTPLEDALSFVHDTLVGFGIRNRIKLIASGKILNAQQIYQAMCLGADTVNSARGMMLAIGCIQALRCNTNHCPAGVATTDPKFYKGLDVTNKKHRVFNYHRKTILAFKELLEVSGVKHPDELDRSFINYRDKHKGIITLEDRFPRVKEGSYCTDSVSH